jgi:hypothetical protein
MLDDLQPDLRELVDLERAAERCDATMVAAAQASRTIPTGDNGSVQRSTYRVVSR